MEQGTRLLTQGEVAVSRGISDSLRRALHRDPRLVDQRRSIGGDDA